MSFETAIENATPSEIGGTSADTMYVFRTCEKGGYEPGTEYETRSAQDTANPSWGDIFESSKLKARTSLLPRFSEKRSSSFELRFCQVLVLF